MNVFDQARQALAWQAPKETQVVAFDEFEGAGLRSIAKAAPVVAEFEATLSDQYAHADALVTDMAALLYTEAPEIRESNVLPPTLAPARALVEATWGTPDMEELRRFTVYDRYNTASALTLLAEAVAPVAKEMAEQAEVAKQAAEDVGDARAALEWELGGGAVPGGPPNEQDVSDRLDELADAIANASAVTSDAADELRARAAVAVGGAIEQANESARSDDAACRGWGVEKGELKKMDAAERAALMHRLKTSRMAEFLKLVGRMKFAALSESARRVDAGRDELYAVTLSGNPADILASEWVALTHPALRLPALARLGEGRMLSRKWRGIQKAAQGPIIVCIDTSGSMGEADSEGITLEAWSKALALGLMALADRQNRAFHTILFSGRRDPLIAVPGTSTNSMLTVAETFIDGGTDWDYPLEKAVELIREGGALAKADVILITDGVCRTDAAFKLWLADQKQELSFRVWGMTLGRYGRTATEELGTICENVRHIEDFSGAGQVTDVMRSL